jgi:hypothetical protein
MSTPEERAASADDLAAKYRSDPRSTGELLSLVNSKDIDADKDYWTLSCVLQHRLPSEFDLVQALSRSANPKEQDDAAIILGQNGVKDKYDVERCQAVLLDMLSQPDIGSPPLASILFALGTLKASGRVEVLLRFQHHSDPWVRYAVTSSLGSCPEESAIKALIELSRDEDFEVRNWATFGLGSLTDADSEEIRRALAERLTESDEEIRGEALVGLVERHDQRAIVPLLRELSQWRNQPLIKDCADKLTENKESFDAKWQPVFEELEKVDFKRTR